MDKHMQMLGKIKSREAFIEFMRLFVPTVQDESVKSYLELLTAWTQDMDGYYKNNGKQMPEDVNWDVIAAMLYAGSIYE